MKEKYERGYDDAIDDVQEAMKQAEVTRFDGNTFESFNDPKLFVEKLKELRKKRFVGTS